MANSQRKAGSSETILTQLAWLSQDIDNLQAGIDNRTVVTIASIESCENYRSRKAENECLDKILAYYEDMIGNIYSQVNQDFTTVL